MERQNFTTHKVSDMDSLINNLNKKNIVIGITSSVAIYKACDIITMLRRNGANVFVIMSKNATEFINPRLFAELSKNPVSVELFEPIAEWEVEHISLAEKADLFLIAPATASIISKVANGFADDMLSTTILATKSPVVFAPAMNTNMWKNPITQENVSKLESYTLAGHKAKIIPLSNKKYHFVGPAYGALACGYSDIGVLSKPKEIVAYVQSVLQKGEGV